MTTLYLWDDPRARRFEPFALTRPVSELRAGTELIRRRWELAFGLSAAGFVAGETLADFEEPDAPPHAGGTIAAGSVVANSRCVVPLQATAQRDAARWACEGELAAVRLARPLELAELREAESLAAIADSHGAAGDAQPLGGRWLRAVWDLVGTLPSQLREDVLALGPTLECVSPDERVIVLGDNPVFLERGAQVEPLAVLDATEGPLLVRRGATVAAFARLVGPAFVGEKSSVLGGKVHATSIGERCKVHGEVSTTVFLAYANKAHDGFVGHSYAGRWVNLGAGTITSNLKNTYGTVPLWTPDGRQDSGLQFLGTLFGDHVKTGIGTRLTTGCVLGAGANVFGAAMPPKAVAPFAWGDGEPYDVYDLERFLTVAERAMARRDMALGERARRQLAAAHAARWQPSRGK